MDLRRLLHISDLHVELYRDEGARMVEFAIASGRARGVDLVIDTGDFYNGRTTPDDRLHGAALVRLITDGAPFLTIAGNHGAPKDVALLGKLETRHPIHVALQPEVVWFYGGRFLRAFENDNVRADALLICCLPWLRKVDLAGAEAVRTGGDLGALAMAAFRRQLERFHEAISQHPGPSIVVAHADVIRGDRSKGNPDVGEELVIPAGWLAELGAEVVLLGHEHGRQEVAPGVVYAGSPRRTRHGEDEPKGFHLVEVAKGHRAIEFVETPCCRMVTIEATWQDGALLMSSIGGVQPGDRIKIRWTVPEDQRVAARQAFDEQRRLFRDAGAAEVIPEEKMLPTVRSRGGAEVAAARSDWEKCQALWRARGIEVAPPRLPRLEVLLGELQREVGASGARVAAAAVRWSSLRMRNMGPFRDVDLAWDRMPGPLTALEGRSGEGKSTILGMLPALLFREHPDGWALPDRAAEGASIEGEVVNGAAWRLRVDVNPRSKKKGRMDGYAFAADGTPVEETKRGGTDGFDGFVRKHFAPKELLLAGPFAAQLGSGEASVDAIEAKAAQRKERLVTALGLERYEVMAQRLRDRISSPRKKGEDPRGLRPDVDRVAAAAASWREQAAGLVEAEALASERRGAHEQAETALATAQAAADAAEEAARVHAERLAQIVERGNEARTVEASARAALTGARARAGEAEERLTRAADQVRALEQEIAGAAAVDEAAARIPRLQEALAAAQHDEEQAAREAEAADAAWQAAREAEQEALRGLDRARSEASAAGQRLADLEATQSRVAGAQTALAGAEAAEQRLPELVEALRVAEAERDRAVEAIRQSEDHDRERARRIVDVERRGNEASRRRDEAARGAERLHDAEDADRRLEGARVAREEAEAALAELDDRIRRSVAEEAERKRRGEQVAPAARETTLAVARGSTTVEAVAGVPCGGPAVQPTCRFLVDAAAIDLVALAAAARVAEQAVAVVAAEPMPAWYLPSAGHAAARRDAVGRVAEFQAAERGLAALAAQLPHLREKATQVETAGGAVAVAQAEAVAIRAEETPPWYIAPPRRAVRATLDAPVSVAQRAVEGARAAVAQLVGLRRDAAEAQRIAGELVTARDATASTTMAVMTATGAWTEAGARVASTAASRAAARGGRDRAIASRVAAEQVLADVRAIVDTAAAIERAQRELVDARATCAREQAALDDARAADAAAEGTLATAAAAVKQLLVEHGSVKAAHPGPPDRAAVATAEQEIRAAQAQRAVADAEVTRLTRVAKRASELEAELLVSQEALADATLLADTLGRDGIQAMEIDAAAPAISDLVNDLLARAYSTRFTFRLDTQTEKADGKGVIEGLPMLVYDNTLADPRWQDAKALSGGQRVVIGTAYRIATVIYTARQAGVGCGTLCLDEYGAALDQESAVDYMRMLRRAAEIGGFDRVIFISHHQVMHELADCRVVVAGGRVEVQ